MLFFILFILVTTSGVCCVKMWKLEVLLIIPAGAVMAGAHLPTSVASVAQPLNPHCENFLRCPIYVFVLC